MESTAGQKSSAISATDPFNITELQGAIPSPPKHQTPSPKPSNFPLHLPLRHRSPSQKPTKIEPIFIWTEGSGFNAEKPTQQQVLPPAKAEEAPPGFGIWAIKQVGIHLRRLKKQDKSSPTIMKLRGDGTAVYAIDLERTRPAKVRRYFVEMNKKGLLSEDESNASNHEAIQWFFRIRAAEVQENERRRIERGQMSRSQFAKRTRAALTADPSESEEPVAPKRQKTQ